MKAAKKRHLKVDTSALQFECKLIATLTVLPASAELPASASAAASGLAASAYVFGRVSLIRCVCAAFRDPTYGTGVSSV